MDRNRYSILHYNFKISVRIFFFFFWGSYWSLITQGSQHKSIEFFFFFNLGDPYVLMGAVWLTTTVLPMGVLGPVCSSLDFLVLSVALAPPGVWGFPGGPLGVVLSARPVYCGRANTLMVGPTLFSLHWYAESISLWVFSSASPLGLELTQRWISLGKEKKMIYLIFVVFLVTASITVGGLFFLGLFQA